MRITFLNTYESKGGAAIAAKRLMNALRKVKIDVKMMVTDKQTENHHIISVNPSFLKKKMNRFRFIRERIIILLNNGFRFHKEDLYPISIANTGVDISRHPEIKKTDIIHIHWINQGFLSIKDLNKLIRTGKPIVWTMHDMWPCTGICHHARTCDKFTNKCGKCFFLRSEKENDLSYKIFAKKRESIFLNNNITFVGCSKWLAGKANISTLTKDKRVVSIPNPIDTDVFHITDKMNARKQLELPYNRKLLLFGAANITDKRKGIHYLFEALNILKTQYEHREEKLSLVTFGQVKDEFKTQIAIPMYSMGYMTNTNDIVSLYNAVDLFITPSLEENLPNTIMEAMACGTPCVGFHTGGIPEMIDHKKNGYVAGYKNAKELAKGINWVLDEADYNEISGCAREKVVNNYSEEIIAKQYIELYKSL